VLAAGAGSPERAHGREPIAPHASATIPVSTVQRFQQPGHLRPVGSSQFEQPDARAQAPAVPPPLIVPQGPPLPAAAPFTPAQPGGPRSPATPPPPVTANGDGHTLNMIRSAPEQIGQVPSQFVWIRDGLMAARGPLDYSLVFFGDDGRVHGRAKLPSGFAIEDIIAQPDAIRLIDFSRRTQIVIPRTVDPATTFAFAAVPNSADPAVRALRLQRRGPQELVLNEDRRAGARSLTIRSIAGGQLAQAYEISPGTNDSRYVVTEEIAAVKPSLTVRVVVQRFDRDGKLSGVVHVPLGNFEEVPRNFIAVTGSGQVRVLRPAAEGIRIDEYDFTAPPRGNRRLNDNELRSLSRKLREIAVETTVQGDTTAPFNDNGDRLELDVPTPPITRAKVLENARAYLSINWVMRPENFARAGIENRCDPARSYIWLRPRHFARDMIGTTIGPMPYRWGGDDTPATFRTRTEWGALAGDLCTCRQAAYNYCLFADSAGVDCSGFVSRAWGIEKRGTSGLLDVATDVDSIAALRPGDAFNWPQRHIRLFVGLAEGAATAFTVLESSTRYRCEGVCESVYRPSEMNGYRLIRYKGISENGVVVSSAPDSAASPTGPAAETSTPNGAAAASAPKAGRRATTRAARPTGSPRRPVYGVAVKHGRMSWR
jgi:hypothetical protein